MKAFFTLMVAAASAAIATIKPAEAQTRGVTSDEVLIAYLTDLSGPVAEFGRSGANAIRMAVEEINEKGGINGRKLRVIVEDYGYDTKKAVLATQKLIDVDKIFALVSPMGAGPVAAAYPLILKSGLPLVCPQSNASVFSEPLQRLSFACLPSTSEMVSIVAKHFMEREGKKRFCLIYQDDELGVDTKDGLEKVLSKSRLNLVESASHKKGASADFGGQVARVQAANCDALVLGTQPLPAAAILQEVRRRQWNVTIINGPSVYEESTIRLAQGAAEGTYAVGFVPVPDVNRSPPEVVAWIKKYESKYGTTPSIYTTYPYFFTYLLAEALQRAGRDLTVDSFVTAMESIRNYKTLFGATINFSPTNHLGPRGSAILFQVKNGLWTQVEPLTSSD